MANGMNFNLRVVVAGINYSMSIDTASSNFIIKGD